MIIPSFPFHFISFYFIRYHSHYRCRWKIITFTLILFHSRQLIVKKCSVADFLICVLSILGKNLLSLIIRLCGKMGSLLLLTFFIVTMLMLLMVFEFICFLIFEDLVRSLKDLLIIFFQLRGLKISFSGNLCSHFEAILLENCGKSLSARRFCYQMPLICQPSQFLKYFHFHFAVN